MTAARTPGPWTVVPSAVLQRFDLKNEDSGLIWNRSLKNSAACELAATKNAEYRATSAHDALTAENAALRKALTRLVNAYQDEITRANNDVPLTSAALYQARATLAKDGE